MSRKSADLLILLILAVSIAILAHAITRVNATAVIWTDKADYVPEETVTIYGSGFSFDASITVSVTRPDLEMTVNSWDVIADGNGNFVTTYQLDGITGTYTIEATDGTNTATTTFTDDVGIDAVYPSGTNVGAPPPAEYDFLTTDNIYAIVDTGGGSGANNLQLRIADIIPAMGGSYPSDPSVTIESVGPDAPNTYFAYSVWTSPLQAGTFYIVADLPPYGTRGGNDKKSLAITITPAHLMSVKYSIVYDGTPTAPTFHYVDPYDVVQTYTLTGVATNIAVKPGSAWYVDPNPLAPESDADERWVAVAATLSGTAGSSGGSSSYNFEFFHQYWLTVTATPSGAVGATCDISYKQNNTGVSETAAVTPWHGWVDANQYVDLDNAQEYYPSAAGTDGTRYWFNEYYPSDHERIDDTHLSLVLKYLTQYEITFGVSPAGGGTTSPSGSVWWIRDVSYSIDATANPGYAFKLWAHDIHDIVLDSPGSSTSARAYGPSSLTAVFDLIFQPFTVSGYKYDTEGDPVDGWTIQLYKDTWVTPYATTTTAASTGYYEFIITEPGSYRICEVLQSDWTQITPSGPSYYEFTTTIGGDDITDKDFVNFENVDVTVYKYEDKTGDGLPADDTPISGWTVKLYKGGVLQDTQQTGLNGGYTWSNLGPGSYAVGEDCPSGWIGTSDLYHSFGAVESGESYSYTITNFEYFDVSGTKYEYPDVAAKGWEIQLWQDGICWASATTDDTGHYEFLNVGPGVWQIKEVLPSGWTEITPKLIYGTGAAELGYEFTAYSGQDVTGQDFTNFEWLTISGHKYENGKGGLSGWTIKLYNQTSGLVYDTTTTGAGGTYSFTVKYPGTYTLNETLKAGWTALVPTYKVGDDSMDVEVDGYFFTVASGVPVSNEDFINFKWVEISGYKYEDTDGSKPTTHPLENWQISLWRGVIWLGPSSEHIGDAFADVNGYYEFNVTFPGYYGIGEVIKPGWTMTGPHNVVGDDTVTILELGYGPFEVTSGDDVSGLDFWNFKWLKVSGYKQDTEGNGLEDWNIKLFNATSGLLIDSNDTLSDGYYEILVTNPGDYWVNETLLAGWTKVSPAPTVIGDSSIDKVVDGYSFTAASGTDVPNRNFTNFEWATVAGTKTEYGCSGLEGWTIKAVDGLKVYSDDTDGSGNFLIEVKEPGTYDIKEVLQAGWTMTSPSVHVGSGSDEDVTGYPSVSIGSDDAITGKNFVNFEWLTISGHKYDYIPTFCDNFDSTPINNDPSGWTEHGSGIWSVEKDPTAPSKGANGYGDVYSGNASSTTYTRDFSFITLGSSFRNGIFEFKFKLNTDTTLTPRITIPARYQDGDHWVLFDVDTGVYRTGYGIFVSTSTEWVQLAVKNAVISKNAWHTMMIVLDGWNYELWIDGVLQLYAHDTVQAYSSGGIGLGVYRDTHAHFDDVCLIPATNPLEDWTIELYRNSESSPYATATTGVDGYYEFTVKDPGSYQLKELLLDKWTEIFPVLAYSPGDGSTPSVLGYSSFTVRSGVDITSGNFWNFKWVTVSGYKFFDANGNGKRETGEPGLQYWQIKLNIGSTQYLPPATTGLDGCYEFVVKDPGIYTVSEMQKPPMWIPTTPPSGTYTFTAQSGADENVDFGNWLGSSSFVTTSGLCWFDVDPTTDDRQFKLIFTPDVPSYPNKYRLTASNPGQFYYNIFYTGSGSASFTINIPYPFVTQGANPIHVYSSLNTGPCGCLVPGTDITSDFEISPSTILFEDWDGKTFGDTLSITISGPSPGFLYINIHLDYGLKKNVGNLDKDFDGRAYNSTFAIDNYSEYSFSVLVAVTDEQIVENMNVFKRDPGFVGMVTDSEGNPLAGVKVLIYGPTGKLLATVYTDKDGWYFYNYKYTGKAATFTIKLPAYNKSTSVTIKSNSMTLTNFVLP